MTNFIDFCKWMKSQRRAADALGVSESTVSRMASGKVGISPAIAERCEQISHGLFRKEAMLWPLVSSTGNADVFGSTTS
jgi:DNA-binding transcriptional regulator YdaS (Cro superfamily)